MKKILVITALTYRAISSGYIYDLSFKINDQRCFQKSVKTSFSIVQCNHPPIDGYGIVNQEKDGLWLNWYDCLRCGFSDRKLIE
jgi:hypothetical protein